jgi:hypothetical protein
MRHALTVISVIYGNARMSQRTFSVDAANTTARRLSFYFAALQVGDAAD